MNCRSWRLTVRQTKSLRFSVRVIGLSLTKPIAPRRSRTIPGAIRGSLLRSTPVTGSMGAIAEAVAASGKRSVARQLARRLDFFYVNSGAMYRAVTWFVLNHGIDLGDKRQIAQLIGALALGRQLKDGEFRLLIDDIDLTEHLHE